MESSLPISTRRSRRGAFIVVAYVIVLIAAFASGRAWLAALAAMMLASLLLWPSLRKRSLVATSIWLAAAAGTTALLLTDRADLALDFMPVMVNVALAHLFARTLTAAHAPPLIARLIAVLESPQRLAMPGVAAYARSLTFAWALLLAAQAMLLIVLICCAVPDGLLARFGARAPIEVTGTAWRWYLHLGSYATVLAFLVIEYAWRRWHLRHIEHVPLATFITHLVRRWPALARSMMHDDPIPRAGS